MLSRFTACTAACMAAALMTLAGCSKGSTSLGVHADPARAAHEIYAHRCASCHGQQGRGDGPLARSLPVAPRAFANAEWQTTATNERIEQAIVRGGEAVGGSALMPPNPDLGSDPRVLRSLVSLIRGFKSPSE